MQQTFLSYVLTDLRFWASSTAAIVRSLLIPATLLSLAFGFVFGPTAIAYVFVAALAFGVVDWFLLIVRMARRIALRIEQPNALLERSVFGNAVYLYRAYYVGPMPSLRAVRG